jgi:hypothetical protein
MPVLTQAPQPVLDPATAYERLAFRCSLIATLTDGEVTDGTLSIHATKYRKVDGLIDIHGIQQQAEKGASLTWGQSEDDDALIREMAEIVAVFANITQGALTLNVAWREQSGDIVGMVHAAIGDWTYATGNSNDSEAQDPAFAEAFQSVLSALAIWCADRGW